MVRISESSNYQGFELTDIDCTSFAAERPMKNLRSFEALQ